MDNVPKQWADWLVAYNAANGIEIVDDINEGIQILNPDWSDASPFDSKGEKALRFGKHLQQWD